MASLRWKIAQYFEKRWWKNYLGKQEPGGYMLWKTNYWNGLLTQINEWVVPDASGRYLDMGCGPAGIFMVLLGKVTAVDPLLDSYKKQAFHFKPETFGNVTFMAVRAEDFICDEPFDIVFSMNVINHVTDISQAVTTLYSCCKPGGKLVISVDAHNFSFLRTIFRYLHFDILHPHQLMLTEYKKLLEKEGLVISGDKCLKKGNIFSYHVLVVQKPETVSS